MRLHLPDRTPLITIGAHTVLNERHEVLFKDDTTIALHQVLQGGVCSRYLRCFQHDELHAVLVDVRDLARNLGAELPIAQDRDVDGLISWTLRLKYRTAAEFKAAAMAVLRGAAPLPQPEPVQRPLNLLFSSGGAGGFLDPEAGNRRFFALPQA